MFKLSPVLFISINWCAVFCLCLLHVVVLFILLLDPDLIFLFCDNLFWVFCFRVCGQVLRIGILKFLGISDYLSGNQNFLVFETVFNWLLVRKSMLAFCMGLYALEHTPYS